MSDDSADIDGFISAQEYAILKYMKYYEVIDQLKDGTIEGRIINDVQYVKSSLKPRSAQEIAAKLKANQVAKATTKVKRVQVTGISIPFADVLALSFQGLIAGLIIVVPIAFIISIISNS